MLGEAVRRAWRGEWAPYERVMTSRTVVGWRLVASHARQRGVNAKARR